MYLAQVELAQNYTERVGALRREQERLREALETVGGSISYVKKYNESPPQDGQGEYRTIVFIGNGCVDYQRLIQCPGVRWRIPSLFDCLGSNVPRQEFTLQNMRMGKKHFGVIPAGEQTNSVHVCNFATG